MVHSHAPKATRAGFTLIELMATVAIVGVLAVVAYAGYHKFVVSSHQTEANAILAGIKNRQEAYKAETGSYLDISPSLASNQHVNFTTSSAGALYPHCATAGVAPPGGYKVEWPSPASTCPAACCRPNTDWRKLKIESSAPTFYGYTTVAGCNPATPNCPTSDPGATLTIKIGATRPTYPSNPLGSWFMATAVGDPDGNGIFSTIMINSFDNQVYVDNDGE